MTTGKAELIRRLYAEVWSNADFGALHDLLAPQFTYHFRGRPHVQTPDDLASIVKRWKAAFPDVRFTVEEVVAEGEVAAARVVYEGTHRGEWKGIAPTGRTVRVHEMMFFRFGSGRIAEVWEVTDEHALRQQLTGPDG